MANICLKNCLIMGQNTVLWFKNQACFASHLKSWKFLLFLQIVLWKKLPDSASSKHFDSMSLFYCSVCKSKYVPRFFRFFGLNNDSEFYDSPVLKNYFPFIGNYGEVSFILLIHSRISNLFSPVRQASLCNKTYLCSGIVPSLIWFSIICSLVSCLLCERAPNSLKFSFALPSCISFAISQPIGWI